MTLFVAKFPYKFGKYYDKKSVKTNKPKAGILHRNSVPSVTIQEFVYIWIWR